MNREGSFFSVSRTGEHCTLVVELQTRGVVKLRSGSWESCAAVAELKKEGMDGFLRGSSHGKWTRLVHVQRRYVERIPLILDHPTSKSVSGQGKILDLPTS